MIVGDFDDQLQIERLPLAGTFGGPAARSARSAAGEARRFADGFEFSSEFGFLGSFDGGTKADVMQQAIVIVEAEQQGTDKFGIGAVAKSADDTVDAADLLDFLHAGAIAGAVWNVAELGDDAIETFTGIGEPFFGDLDLGRGGREE